MPGFSSGWEAHGPEERVGHRAVLGPVVAGPVPGEVVPPPLGVDVCWSLTPPSSPDAVLVGHVHVRIPQGAEASPAGEVPGGIGGRAAAPAPGTKVLSSMTSGSSAAGTVPASTGASIARSSRLAGVPVDKLVLDLVADEVRRRFARVDAEAREAVGVVVQVEEAGALVVGEVQGGRARARVVGGSGRAFVHRLCPGVEPHVGDVDQAGAGAVRALLPGRRDPLVLRAAADPGGEPAVQVQRGAVLRIDVIAAVRARAGAP